MATAPPRTAPDRAGRSGARRGSTGTRRTGSSRRPRPRKGTAGRRRRRPKRRSRRSIRAAAGRWWPALLVAAAVLVGVAWDHEDGATSSSDACTMPGSGVTVTPEQIGNARAIAQVARDRGLPDRAVVIALATAQQESRLRNLDHGDRDSLGLFQQRPSQGWGTEAQVQDPVYAAGKFYDGLVHIPGWDTGRLTDIAQAVQRSGHPELYQQHEAMAVELTAALGPDGTGTPPCG